MSFKLSIFASRCIANYWLPLRTCRRFFSESYYDILKVSPTCSAKEIREAFLVLSKKTHPDKHLNDPSMHEKFVRINEAYSTLIKPSSRRAYDLTLYNERKLNPPYDNPYSNIYARRRTSNYESYQSSKSTQQTYSDNYKNPFFWKHKSKTENNFRQQYSSALHGVQRFSNTVVVGILLIINVVGVLLLFISYDLAYRDQALKKSKKYNAELKTAQENAKLYGNDHQIEVLKRNLANSFNIDKSKSISDPKSAPVPHVDENLSNNKNEGKDKMLNDKKGYHDKELGSKPGVCDSRGSPGQCPVHKSKSNMDFNQPPEKRSVQTNSPDVYKTCEKCGHKIY